MPNPLTIPVLGLCLALASPACADELAGTWLSQSGETRIRIAPCGGSYCGTIVWTRRGGTDEKNPDAAKRSRSLVGVQMMYGVKPVGGGAYAGSLYNYTDGKTYSGKMRPKGASALELSGCVLGGMICRSQTWTRAD